MQIGWFLKSTVSASTGKEFIYSFSGHADILGLPEGLLGQAADYEIRAGADAVIHHLPRRALSRIRNAPEFWRSVYALLAEEQRKAMDQSRSLTLLNLNSRLARQLLSLAAIMDRTPSLILDQGHIARAIGASRPKVNRYLEILERQGIITLRNGRLVSVRDRDLLGKPMEGSTVT